MKDLIAELEKAEAGSRELDGRVAESLGHEISWRNDMVGDAHPVIHYKTSTWAGVKGACPHYTTSIDDALTLVPEGCYWHACSQGQIGLEHLPWAGVFGGSFIGSECDSHGATPALALVIASLKASETER